MNCKNHPEKRAIAVCQKYNRGYCGQCCDCNDLSECCGCSDPKFYCAFRSQCLIWELSRSRRKADGASLQSGKKSDAPPPTNLSPDRTAIPHQESNGPEKELAQLKAELVDRKAALPMHDATPRQWMAIEELEDRIADKKKELKTLNQE